MNVRIECLLRKLFGQLRSQTIRQLVLLTAVRAAKWQVPTIHVDGF
jgi:hypothetical protein